MTVMHLKVGLIGTAAVSALCLATTPAAAGGFYLQEQSVRGMGRAFSGEAADTGAQSLWWNPAAIAGMSSAQNYFGATAIMPRGTQRDTGSVILRPGQPPAPVGGRSVTKNPVPTVPVPSGAVAVPLDDRIAVGLAVTSPYSFSNKLGAESWGRYVAENTKVRMVDIQPTLAFAPTDWLRIGAGPNVEYFHGELDNTIPNIVPGGPDGEQSLKGGAWNVGWSVGVQIHNEFITVGISYRSKIRHKIGGHIAISGLTGPAAAENQTIRSSATLDTPWLLAVGARLRLSDRWTLNGQVVRSGWSKFDAIRIEEPINQAIVQNYKDAMSYAAGVDYSLSPRVTLRAGVQRDLTPTQDGFRDPRIPDGNRWIYAGGASVRLTKRITLDVAASYIHIAATSLTRTSAFYIGTPLQTVVIANGKSEKPHAFEGGLGATFDF